MSSESIVAIIAISVLLLLIGFAIKYSVDYYNKIYPSEYEVTDRDLMLAIRQEVDHIITTEALSAKLGITNKELKTRMNRLLYAGVIKKIYDSRMKALWTLKENLSSVKPINLSQPNRLSLMDIEKIFHEYGYKVTMSDLLMATGLPFVVLRKELKRLIKEGYIRKITNYDPTYSYASYFYILSQVSKEKLTLKSAEESELDLESLKLKEKVENRYRL